jgi:hypothetical protein
MTYFDRIAALIPPKLAPVPDDATGAELRKALADASYQAGEMAIIRDALRIAAEADAEIAALRAIDAARSAK